MMTEDQIQEFVDRQYTAPRFFHGEDQIINQIDYYKQMEKRKTRQIIRARKREKKNRKKKSKNKLKN